jgi:hypothetical protein
MLTFLRNTLRDLRLPSESDREHAYLSEATSLVDLERRQRQLDMARVGKAPQPW